MENKCRLLKSASSKFQEEFMESYKYLGHSCHDHRDIDTFIAFAREQFLSPEKVTAALFDKPLEVFQILGVALLRHSEKNVLLINSLKVILRNMPKWKFLLEPLILWRWSTMKWTLLYGMNIC
jgi:hypothetical protein